MKKHCITGMLLLSVGCSNSEPEKLVFDNEGIVCLNSTASDTLDVSVVFPSCASSSCSFLQTASCNIELSEGEIRIRSHAEVALQRELSCTLDCANYIAFCSPTTIAAGDYVVFHGEQMEAVNLPVPSQKLFDPQSANACPFPNVISP